MLLVNEIEIKLYGLNSERRTLFSFSVVPQTSAKTLNDLFHIKHIDLGI